MIFGECSLVTNGDDKMEGKFEERIKIEKVFTEKETEVGDACHIRLDKFSDWIGEAKKELMMDIHYLVQWFVDAKFTPNRMHPEVKRVLDREILKLREDFVKWFGE